MQLPDRQATQAPEHAYDYDDAVAGPRIQIENPTNVKINDPQGIKKQARDVIGRVIKRRPEHAPEADAPMDEKTRLDIERIEESALFHRADYLNRYPDVAASGMNPLRHFHDYGHVELRNPSADFDSVAYWLSHIDDVGLAGNPLTHYFTSGREAGLTACKSGEMPEADKKAAIDVGRARLDDPAGQSARVYKRLAVALEHLGASEPAVQAWRCYLADDWQNATVHARLGSLLTRRSQWWQAADAWQTAVSLNDTHANWFFKLGEAQQAMGRFQLSADAYQRAIDRKPGDALWQYHLGYAHEQAGQSGQPEQAEAAYAEAAYCEAIALKPRVTYRHWRLGFVRERQNNLLAAADAYAAAAQLSTKRESYWHYRHGYVLAQAGQYEHACRAWIQTRDKQILDGELFYPPQDNPAADEAGDVDAQVTDSDMRSRHSTKRITSSSMSGKCPRQTSVIPRPGVPRQGPPAA